MVDIQAELEKNPILLSALSGEFYNNMIVSIMQNLGDKKICYVTLNKPSASLVKHFRFNGVNTGNVFFIDAITSSIDKNKKMDNGILVSSPYAFTELSIAISEALRSKMFDLLVFDSLSALKIYSDENTAIRFTSTVINRIRSNEFKGIFTCLEDDVKTNFIRQSSMYVDGILDLNELAEQLKKGKLVKVGGALAFVLAFLAVFSLFGTGNNSMTGLAVSSVSANAAVAPSIVLIIAVIAGVLAFYKNEILTKLHNLNLKNVNQPIKILDKGKLRAKFRKIINKWLGQPS